MSARSQLQELIEASAPETWEVHAHPLSLPPLDDPTKPVAVVIEQRAITAGAFSPDANGIATRLELLIWVAVDATTGGDLGDVEDLLEAAAEAMILILEPMPDHVWDGTATRDKYDDQKPAYQFTIRAAGALTPEETP